MNHLRELAATVRELAPDTLILVDVVTSLGGAELRIRESQYVQDGGAKEASEVEGQDEDGLAGHDETEHVPKAVGWDACGHGAAPV